MLNTTQADKINHIYLFLSRPVEDMVLGSHLSLRASNLPFTTVLIPCEGNLRPRLAMASLGNLEETSMEDPGWTPPPCPFVDWTVVRVNWVESPGPP